MNLKEYIHNAQGRKFYCVCSTCGSKAMKHEPTTISLDDYYICMECGSVEINPKIEELVYPYVPVATNDPWISINDLAKLIHIKSFQKN